MTKPELLEFAEPVSGTFPLWYDPAYWYAGVKAKFDWQAAMGGAPAIMPRFIGSCCAT